MDPTLLDQSNFGEADRYPIDSTNKTAQSAVYNLSKLSSKKSCARDH